MSIKYLRSRAIEYAPAKTTFFPTDEVMSYLLIKLMVNVIMFNFSGFFLIRRGTDECGIEGGVTAGVPDMSR